MKKLFLLSLVLISCSSDSYENDPQFKPGDEIIGLHSIIDLPESSGNSQWLLDKRIMGEIEFSSINQDYNDLLGNSFVEGANGEFKLNYITQGQDPISLNNTNETVTVFFSWSYDEKLSRWNIELDGGFNIYTGFLGIYPDAFFSPRSPYNMVVTFSNGLYTMKPLPNQEYSDKLILYFK